MPTVMGSDYIYAPNGFYPQDGVSNARAGGIAQCVNAAYTTPYTVAFSANTHTSSSINATITPRSSGDGILIYARWCGEMDNLWDVVWNIARNGSIISDPGNTPGNRNPGIMVGGDSYAAAAENNASTPAMVDLWYYDEPGTTAAVTYSLYFRRNTASTLYVNRTIIDSNTVDYERYISQMSLFELAR